MIKGVNKQVLEINDVENGFFEKAIFFVKPEYCGMGEGKLRECARAEVESTAQPPERSYRSKKRELSHFLLVGGAFVAGVIIGVIAGGGF